MNDNNILLGTKYYYYITYTWQGFNKNETHYKRRAEIIKFNMIGSVKQVRKNKYCGCVSQTNKTLIIALAKNETPRRVQRNSNYVK